MTDQSKMMNDIQSSFEQNEDRLRGALNEAEKKLKQGQQQIAKLASGVDKYAHDNPWPVIAGVGVGCLLLGLILGKSKN